MNLDDLWIGDVLRIRSTGQVGVFNGLTLDRLAIIKSTSGAIHHISEDDLEMYTEPNIRWILNLMMIRLSLNLPY